MEMGCIEPDKSTTMQFRSKRKKLIKLINDIYKQYARIELWYPNKCVKCLKSNYALA